MKTADVHVSRSPLNVLHFSSIGVWGHAAEILCHERASGAI